MRQQQTFGGFISILLMPILVAIVVRFPYARQADRITNRGSIKILGDGQTADVSIHQDSQTPTGGVILTFLDGQVKRFYVSDVKGIQELLEAHDMAYVTMDVPQENHLVTIILPFMLSIVVMVIIIVIMDRSASGGGADAGMINFGKSRARISRDSKINFSNVAGLVKEKGGLEEMVGLLKSPRKYTSVGARIPKGLLLVGPPGTGRTLFTKAVAGEAGVPFFSILGLDFVEMFMGMGASCVRDLFEEARKNSPCIVFIDEVDTVTRRKGTSMGDGHDKGEQTPNQLLVEMDGFGVNEGIIIMTAVNRVGILDPAIPRPGRFDREVVMGHPDVKGHEEILRVHSEEKPLSEDADLHRMAQTTSDFTGADLENLINEVATISTRENRRFIEQSDIDRVSVKVGIDVEKRSKVISEKDRKIAVYYRTSRAILFHVLPDVGSMHTVSIIPTGVGAAGYAMPLPEEDEMFNTGGHMKQNIMVDLGSRIAEELIFDNITTDASRDIRQATQITRAMVIRYSISERVGMTQYDGDENEVLIGRDLTHAESCGNKAADTIDSEVKRIIDECYQKAKDIIKQYDYVFHACADLLIEKGKINQSEFETLFTPVQ